MVNASLRVFPSVFDYNQNWGTHFVIQKHFSKSTIKNRCFLCSESTHLYFQFISPFCFTVTTLFIGGVLI